MTTRYTNKRHHGLQTLRKITGEAILHEEKISSEALYRRLGDMDFSWDAKSCAWHAGPKSPQPKPPLPASDITVFVNGIGAQDFIRSLSVTGWALIEKTNETPRSYVQEMREGQRWRLTFKKDA